MIRDNKDKKAESFRQLDSLSYDADNEYEEDTNRIAFTPVRKGLLATAPLSIPDVHSSVNPSKQGEVSTIHSEKWTSDLKRSNTEPLLASSKTVVIESSFLSSHSHPKSDFGKKPTSQRDEASVIQDTPAIQRNLLPGPRRTMSAPVRPVSSSSSKGLKMTASITGKRKRKDDEPQMKPEADQVFRGLTFLYVPDDGHPLRKTRIKKAQEDGAIWVKELKPEVTHVVVDERMDYRDVLTHLKISSLPQDIILINDNYVVDCIQFRIVLLLPQKKYDVKGSEARIQSEVPSQASSESVESLKVKTKRSKYDFVPEVNTPPRSEYSQLSVALNEGAIARSPDPKVGVEKVTRGEDFRQASNLTKKTSNKASTTINREDSEGRRILRSSPSVDIGGQSKKGDELDSIIRSTLEQGNVFLGASSDEATPSSGEPSSSHSSDFSQREGFTPPPSKDVIKNKSVENSWSCMRGGTFEGDNNENLDTITTLEEMATLYSQEGDNWRSQAYRKAITKLKQHPQKISTAKEARQIKIGDRLAKKIEEIVSTGCLRRLESARNDSQAQVIRLFRDIYGVGTAQASLWVQQGHKTLSDLKANVHLTENQLIGIVHYDDFLTRIPREEVTALGEVVKTAGAKIDSKVEIIIGGSYRRGQPTSGDIDLIITKPGTTSSTEIKPFLNLLVASLTESHFLVHALSSSSASDGTKWNGCCVLPRPPPSSSSTPSQTDPPSPWRRIDLLLVPESEIGAALIYFTGNDIFNRSIRLLVSKKGMRLNQRGLYQNVMRGDGRVKMNEGELVEGKSERRIFEILGVQWREPWERIC